MCRRLLLLLWTLLPCAAAGGSGRTFPHRTLLDSEGKYWLSWGPRDGRLAFRLEVRTAGYVGFGFSPTGAMAAADIVVGGVDQGRPYLQVSVSPPGAARRAPSCPDPGGSVGAGPPGPPAVSGRDGRRRPAQPRARPWLRSAPAPLEPKSPAVPLPGSAAGLRVFSRADDHGSLQAVFCL